jgi:hypothetical protein
MNVRNLLIAWIEASEGNFVEIGADGEIDYRGSNVNEAMTHVTACDEIEIGFYEVDGTRRGWGGVVNEYGEDPELYDHSCGDFGDWLDGLEADDYDEGF